jgi:hypothetical protein
MKLRAQWAGAVPLPGEYLMSSMRPRYAYRITSVEAKLSAWSRDAADEVAPRPITLIVTRVKAADVPSSSTIHDWKWSPRDPKSKEPR